MLPRAVNRLPAPRRPGRRKAVRPDGGHGHARRDRTHRDLTGCEHARPGWHARRSALSRPGWLSRLRSSTVRPAAGRERTHLVHGVARRRPVPRHERIQTRAHWPARPPFAPETVPETAVLSDFRGSRAVTGPMSSTPGAVLGCRSMMIRGVETQGRGSDHGRRRAAGLAVVTGSAEPFADGTGMGLRRLGPALRYPAARQAPPSPGFVQKSRPGCHELAQISARNEGFWLTLTKERDRIAANMSREQIPQYI